MRAPRRIVVAALLFAVATAAVAEARPATRAVAPMALLSGPDVSSNNHPGHTPIGWGRVSSGGRAFAVIKATGENGYTNPWFRRDWAGAGKAGLIRAAYHYALPHSRPGDAIRQATQFVNTVAGAGGLRDAGAFPLVLDLERSNGLAPAALQSWTAAFVETVTRLSGRLPMIYTYTYFWKHQMANSHAFTSYPLWIASYTPKPPSPLPGGWASWALWQYTDRGRLPGVAGNVDLSVFGGSGASLATFADGRQLPVLQRWQATGGLNGTLGAALTALTMLPDGTRQDFAGGSIFSSALGTYVVRGASLTRYDALGGPDGPLGFPTSDTGAADPTGSFATSGITPPQLTTFAGGDLVNAAGGPAYQLADGTVLDRWTAEGGVAGVVGLPIADLGPVTGGTAAVFLNGEITSSPDRGVHELTGPVLAAWLNAGGADSRYGLPSSDVYDVPLGQEARFGDLIITVAAP